MVRLCPECFDNSALKRRLVEIRPKVGRGKCDIHPTRTGIPISDVCEIIDEVFRNNYTRADDSEFGDGESLTDTIEELTSAVDSRVAESVSECLIDDEDVWPPDGDEPFYQDDFTYERIPVQDSLHGALWNRFQESIIHERRFFNQETQSILANIFRNIHLQRDVAQKSPVYMLEPNKAGAIFRARIATRDQMLEIVNDPVGGLGPAPRRRGHAGRMNVAGIPVFYGSFDLPTCAAELRPPVGSHIVSAEFELARTICVLDMTRFRSRPKQLDLFTKDHVRRLTQWRFMQRFRREISKPILKTDEHIDYVPTQVVAEYLNSVHEVRLGDQKCHIDAIIFNSAQRPTGRNIVILGQASEIEPLKGIRKKRTLQSSAPSLDLFVDAKPRRPGLRIKEISIAVSRVKKAEIGLESSEPLRTHLNPPF